MRAKEKELHKFSISLVLIIVIFLKQIYANYTMPSKSQTATEYLIILSVVIIIALVVVSTLGAIPRMGGQVSEQQALLALQAQTIGITQFSVTDYATTLTLRNNHQNTVRIESIHINDEQCHFFIGDRPLISPGRTYKVECPAIHELDAQSVSWPIVIRWTDTRVSATYAQRGEDLRLVTQVGEQYMSVLSGNTYWNGNGCFDVNDDPIAICTCGDLNQIQMDLTPNYVLQNSIDFLRCEKVFGLDFVSGGGWEPIEPPYLINFNGQKNLILGLHINRPGGNYLGLFSIIETGNISNVYLTGEIIGNNNVGGLVGFQYATSVVMKNYFYGSVTGNTNVGGLVGYNLFSEISNSYFQGSVTGNTNVGGLVGYNLFSDISNSYSNGSVSGMEYVGGLVGYRYGNEISNSYTTSLVTCTGSPCGGLIGSNSGGTCSGTNTWLNHSNDDANACVGSGSACAGCTP